MTGHGARQAGKPRPLADAGHDLRQPLQTILDMTKDKIPLMPGVDYTGGNIAETADTLRACAK